VITNDHEDDFIDSFLIGFSLSTKWSWSHDCDYHCLCWKHHQNDLDTWEVGHED
jgi:hypothetical protein